MWSIEYDIRSFQPPPPFLSLYFSSFTFSLNQCLDVITGAIPDSIGDCIDLREIDASNNALSSTLPITFGQLRSLSLLGLFENQLSGTVPSDALGSLGLLEVLYLDNNSE